MPAKILMASAFDGWGDPNWLSAVFLVCLKFGAVIFGGGYVLLAFLQADLVDRLHWLTQAQLLNAVAVGQVTPGPVFTTATFIGYLLGGVRGAVVATAGIFLPGFVFVAASRPLIPRIRRSKIAKGPFLDGVNVGAVALILVTTLGEKLQSHGFSYRSYRRSRCRRINPPDNSIWLIFTGGLVGLIATGWLAA